VMQSRSAERLGLASGINSTLSRLAGVLAIAVLGPIALLSFGHALTAKTAPLRLLPEMRVQLARESPKLAEAKPPAGLDRAVAEQVRHSIRSAFVDSFRLIARLAASLSWAAALVALILLRSEARMLAEAAPKLSLKPPGADGSDCGGSRERHRRSRPLGRRR
jgi:hypothetical protein